MNRTDRSNFQDISVRDILQEIEQKAQENHRRIYRGESNKCYGQVSSGLYRVYGQKLGIKNPVNVFRKMQEMISKRAEEYLNDTTDFNILAQIQHYGGKTNLIDFTTDYLIALFFACYRADEKDGRIILLSKESTEDYTVREMPSIINRAASQKSVLVEPTNGFIDSKHYDVVEIPKELKPEILFYLQRFHGISTKRVYDDIHGYIQSLAWDQSSYIEWIEGKEYEDHGSYTEAIDAYTRAIGQKLDFFEGYRDRGRLHFEMSNFDQALEDYNMAIELNPDNVDSYYYRGNLHYEIGDAENALDDYSTAIRLSSDDNVDFYHARGRAHFKTGGLSPALADFSKAKELKPGNHVIECDFCHARACHYFKTGMFSMALTDYNRAIELKPDTAILYRDRGTLHLKEGKENLAIIDYKKWIELEDEEGIEVLLRHLEEYTLEYGIDLPEHIKTRLRESSTNP